VQNVSVRDGSNAIVGNVAQPARVLVSDKGPAPAVTVSTPIPAHGSTIPWTQSGEHGPERSRPQYRFDAGEPALRRKNPLRRIVPLAGSARQEALPHARRCAEIRRAKGKPERAHARPLHAGHNRRAKAD